MSRLWFVLLVLTVPCPVQWVRGGLAGNVFMGSNYTVMYPKQYITSPNGQYSMVLRPDCNLVLYNGSRPLVGTNLFVNSSTPDCSLRMQEDGNLVIYNFKTKDVSPTGSNAVWALGSSTRETHSFLALRDDGTSPFYDFNSPTPYNNLLDAMIKAQPANGDPKMTYSDFQVSSHHDYKAWKPYNSPDGFPYMPTGYNLSAGEKLQKSAPEFTLELGTDCKLRSKKAGPNTTTTLWEWGSSSKGSVCHLTLQLNGSLQILGVSESVYWSSNAGSSVSGVDWILTGNPNDEVWRISDIKNSSNVVWELVKPSAKKPSVQLIVGVAGGVVVGVSVLALTVLGLYYGTRERFLDPSERAFQARLRAKGGTSYAFTQAKIKQATKNYENKIGRGGFGDVYKGKLSDGREVAAKVLSEDSHQSKQEFFNEIELLSMVHHKYLVSLVGFSCTRRHQVLIYEFMGGGDLCHRLQGEGSTENPLSWRQRTTIVLQVAEGLEYLHDKCSPPIIHRDVKSTNILLTDQLGAKVADFGLSKLKIFGQENATHVTTMVKGTPGYLDPEYHKTGMLTEKSDVYAFGVVLMEILTGLPHISNGPSHPYITQKVGAAWKAEQVAGLADPHLRDDYDRDEFSSLVELALWCVRKRGAERPDMNQVVRWLYELGLGAGTALGETFYGGIRDDDGGGLQLADDGPDETSIDIELVSLKPGDSASSSAHTNMRSTDRDSTLQKFRNLETAVSQAFTSTAEVPEFYGATDNVPHLTLLR